MIWIRPHVLFPAAILALLTLGLRHYGFRTGHFGFMHRPPAITSPLYWKIAHVVIPCLFLLLCALAVALPLWFGGGVRFGWRKKIRLVVEPGKTAWSTEVFRLRSLAGLEVRAMKLQRPPHGPEYVYVLGAHTSSESKPTPCSQFEPQPPMIKTRHWDPFTAILVPDGPEQSVVLGVRMRGGDHAFANAEFRCWRTLVLRRLRRKRNAAA